MSRQLYFDLDFSPAKDKENTSNPLQLKSVDLRRAVLAWLVKENVNGIGTDTPTRIKRFRADLAGFWNVSKQNTNWDGPAKLLLPCHTIIVELRGNRDACWPDCASSAELLPQLRDLKHKRIELQESIRKNEPQLKDTSTLFEEYTDWHYEKSENTDYHGLCKKIEKTKKAIYKGSRFESMMSAGVADYLYLAVPEKSVHPHELADGWGLIWIDEKLKTRVISKSENRNCAPENRFHLIQNIASSNIENALFRNGVYNKNGQLKFVPLPRKKRGTYSPKNVT